MIYKLNVQTPSIVHYISIMVLEMGILCLFKGLPSVLDKLFINSKIAKLCSHCWNLLFGIFC